ncbi:MAG: RDD family protein [Bacilli bacterium]|nr:RDD family protein [Bacilli bacterium]
MKEDNFEIRNIDGEVIDFSKDDLLEKLTYESANFIRRLISYVIDLLIMIMIWYLITKGLFQEVDSFVAVLGNNEADFTNTELLKQFQELLGHLFLKIVMIWLFIKTVYFTLIPALIGNGQTIGKLLVGIGVVDHKSLNEISPSRLILREFIGRVLIETLFLIPNIVSVFLSFFRKDSKSIHDLLAKTVVIKLDLYNID